MPLSHKYPIHTHTHIHITMSGRSSGTTSRDYVESFVKDKDLENYLSENQPQYDPNKTTPTIEEQQQTPSEKTTSDSKPSTFNFHERSKNPFANEQQQTKQQEIPEKQNVMYVVRDFLDQKKEIHEIAVDNCADLHADLLTCFKDGSWWDKAKMCEHQKQKFWNCYNKQKVIYFFILFVWKKKIGKKLTLGYEMCIRLLFIF